MPAGRSGDVAIDGVDRMGLPVVAADFVGEVEPGFSGFGYGETLEQARTGGYGEVAESVLLTRALRDVSTRVGSYAALLREYGEKEVCDPSTLCLPAGTAWTPDLELTWLPTLRWGTGERVWVPADWVASRPLDLAGEAELTTPITNGLGAGDTAERALAHALLELIQRDGNSVSYRALDTGRVIDISGVDDPGLHALVDRFADAGIELLPKLADDDLGIASVFVVGVDRDPLAPPLAVTACGEAADPHLPTALRKAVLEYASSRARKVFAHGSWDVVAAVAPPDYLDRELSRPVPEQEVRALETMREWTRMSAGDLLGFLEPTVFSQRSIVAGGDIPTTARPGSPAENLAAALEALAGFDVLVFWAKSEVEGATVHVAKVIVPGLECETMSYGRLGGRGLRRLLALDSPLVAVGKRPGETFAPLTLPPEDDIGPAWLDLAGVAATVGPLYPLYREPTRHAVARLG